MAAARAPGQEHEDRTDEPFVTLDPATSTDLDQAFHIEASGNDLILHYAIADVAWFVVDGDPVDALVRFGPFAQVSDVRDLERGCAGPAAVLARVERALEVVHRRDGAGGVVRVVEVQDARPPEDVGRHVVEVDQGRREIAAEKSTLRNRTRSFRKKEVFANKEENCDK